MTHQKQVSIAAKKYNLAKAQAKVIAKAEAKKVYIEVYNREKAKAYAEYNQDILKKHLTLEERLDAEGWTVEEDDE